MELFTAIYFYFRIISIGKKLTQLGKKSLELGKNLGPMNGPKIGVAKGLIVLLVRQTSVFLFF
jgi:hypothetical protein